MKLSKILIKDLISPRKWGIFIGTTFRLKVIPFFKAIKKRIRIFFGLAVEEELTELEIAFNIVFRYLRCRQCAKQGFCNGDIDIGGSCKGCGCSSPDNMLAMNNDCACGKWGSMRKDIIPYIENNFDLLLTAKRHQQAEHKVMVLSEEDLKKLNL